MTTNQELAIELKHRNFALFQRIKNNTHSTQEVKDYIGREPFGYDYTEFIEAVQAL